LDARKCISYLTIEYDGIIPESLRAAMGNRIYGCDDCQIVCPWNKFAQQSAEPDFTPRHGLDAIELLACFEWDEETFLARTEGSAIRRIGYERWRRNVAIALGNAPSGEAITVALKEALNDPSDIVREHVRWALEQHSKSQ
jgi:epoxyqueuosine reductase